MSRALLKQIENGVLQLSDRNGEVTITGRCFIDRYVNPNNSNSPQSKTTCWIGIRARRQFYSCLFIMCSEVLTCRKCLPSYNIFMQPRLCLAQIWTAMVLTPQSVYPATADVYSLLSIRKVSFSELRSQTIPIFLSTNPSPSPLIWPVWDQPLILLLSNHARLMYPDMIVYQFN